jgi:hypothetical protein
MTASTRLPAHSAGTCPRIRNQVVPQGGPHEVSMAKGAYEADAASSKGTGSPGACQASTSNGTEAA